MALPRVLAAIIALYTLTLAALLIPAMHPYLATAWSWAKALVTTAWSAVWQLIS